MLRRAWPAVVVALVACGKDFTGLPAPDATRPADAPADALDPLDERVPIPAPDPSYIDLVTPDEIIMPGEEKMFCLHARNDRGDVAIDNFIGEQGTIGAHHIALYSTTDPEPPGTVEDCTSPEANAKLQWFVVAGAFQPGYAIHLPAGMPYVLQFHYINASDRPLLIRDVGRIHMVDPATVTTWLSSFVMQDFSLELPPEQETAISWDCTIPSDRRLLFVFGHMHEYGARYEIDLGPDTSSLTSIYMVDPWKARMRDAPPIRTFYDQPLALAAGSILRTTCTWRNTTAVPVAYPGEMCLTFAYVAGGDGPFQCPTP